MTSQGQAEAMLVQVAPDSQDRSTELYPPREKRHSGFGKISTYDPTQLSVDDTATAGIVESMADRLTYDTALRT